ncbi:MAG: GNAT family N-acetyltransferase [Pseudomonadota bacterium]
MSALSIRAATRDEFSIAVDWAAQEGWNPGIEDLEAFHMADPHGFLMGWIDDVAVSSISVVRYGQAFGFLGFYIVHPEHRRSGIGLATWNAGMVHLKGRTIALDGVVDQQDNYRKSGFDYFARNIRLAGVAKTISKSSTDLAIRPLVGSDFPDLLKLDQLCFPADRSEFISNWCLPKNHSARTTHIARSADGLVGFGTIRPCCDGYKIGPLIAHSDEAATSLFASLSATINEGEPVILDVPEINAGAVELATSFGLEPVFETARMVRGTPIDVQWEKVFGITSFELG